MNKFAQAIIRYRTLIIIITILLTIFFGIGLTRIRINSDILTYLKPEDPIVKLFNRVGDEYDGNFLVMVGIETDDIFAASSLGLIRDLTESYRELEGVKSVMSLTDVLDIRKNEGMLEIGRLIDKDNIPQSPEEIKRLKEYTMSKELYRGRLVSEDSRITLIVCRITHDVNRAEVGKKIRKITEEKGNNGKFYYSGIPIQILDMQEVILGDVIKLVPLVSLVIVVILFFSFRSARGVILPLVGVLISTIWSLGFMGWMGVNLSLISNIMPVVLIAIGSAYGIHFVSKYNEDAILGGEKKEVTSKALTEVSVPIILAGITTLIGFVSFIGSYLTAITEFGIYTAIGVGFALIVSITFIPSIISFLKVKAHVKKTDEDQETSKIMGFISKTVLKQKWVIFSIVILISLTAIIGLPRIKREIDILEYFPKHSNTRIAEEMMRTQFGGSTPIQVIIKGDIKDPYVLKKINDLEKFIDSLPYVSNTQSIASLISEMNNVMNGHFNIPETKEEVANLWFFIEGEEILSQMVNQDSSEALIQARLATENTQEILKLVKTIDQYLSKINQDSYVIALSDLKTDETKKSKAWLSENISDSIYYDVISRIKEADKDLIKNSVAKAIENGNFAISDDEIRNFRAELDDFFKTESQLVLSSDNSISIMVNALIDSLIAGKTSESDIMEILKKNTPRSLIAEDPEALDLTVPALKAKFAEFNGKARVDSIMTQIMPIFSNELISNQDFINDVRGDLWIINEKALALPEELGIKSPNKITILAVQAGMPMIYDRIDHSLLRNQIQSLILAISMVLIILSVQFRSIKVGLISASPIIFTVLVNFGIMAYFNVPLDIATLMVGGIAIGIGIDYTIHFTNRFRLEIGRSASEEQAIAKVIKTTGRAILVNALSVALGFSILLLAQLSPIRRFGWMVAVTMIVSSLSAITYLPSAIIVSKAKYKSIKE